MRFDNVFWNFFDRLVDDFKLSFYSADGLFFMIELLEIHSRSEAFNSVDGLKNIVKKERSTPNAHR